MKRATLRQTEAQLQGAIVELLTLYERQGRLRFYHVPNQLPRPSILVKLIGIAMVNKIYSLIEQSLKAMGKRNGVPDLVILLTKPRGMTAYWELKSETGTLSDDQYLWLEWLGANGFPAAIVRSVDEAQALLKIYFAEAEAA